MLYISLISIFSLVVLINSVSADVIVETSHGQVQGKRLKTLIKGEDYFGFMGIPYAVPPVKKYRFIPPEPVDPWSDILSATKEKQECVQFNHNVKKGQHIGIYGAEDCLYLNIFTPSVQGPQRPIIVFLHNEYLKYSYNKTKDYAPDFFIEEDVVIATISHRLSVFGFLSFEDDTLLGNSGLKDIVAGLQWIANNAERFGGDPNRITLLGSQGGAVAVDLLIHSSARKIFNSVILQGGTSWSSLYLHENARERAIKLAEFFEIHTKDSERLLKELSKIEAEDLLSKELRTLPQDYNKECQRGLHPFGPVLEKAAGLVTDYPERATQIDLPVMIGFNSQEGLEKSLQHLIEPRYLSFVEKDFVMLQPGRVDFLFNPIDTTYEDGVKDIKQFYFPDGIVTVNNVNEYTTYLGDLFTVPINDMVEHYSKISSKEVFYYYFDYEGGLNENKNDIMKFATVDVTSGAASGDELCYLFMCPGLKEMYLKYNDDETEEIILQRKLVRLWSNFARNGNPTPEDDSTLDVHWPAYKTETQEYLHIERYMEVKQNLLQDRFQFWKQFVKKWKTKATSGTVSDMLRGANDEL